MIMVKETDVVTKNAFLKHTETFCSGRVQTR